MALEQVVEGKVVTFVTILVAGSRDQSVTESNNKMHLATLQG
jgi:hypothetical protein